MSNILEGLFTEEVTVTVKDKFEGVFKFAASEARKRFNITTSADQGAIREWSGSERLSDCWKFMRNNKCSKK